VANLPVYQFDGYTFRPATLEDKPLARQWNMMDSDHKWELQYPDYWIEQNNQVNNYVLEDAISILFFVRSVRHLGNEIEVTLQFDRECGMVSKARVMKGMEVGFAWLKEALPMNGFTALYFVSKNQDLILFTEKRLGFVKDGMREIYRLKGTESEAKQAS
jgi:hypothetical protein